MVDWEPHVNWVASFPVQEVTTGSFLPHYSLPITSQRAYLYPPPSSFSHLLLYSFVSVSTFLELSPSTALIMAIQQRASKDDEARPVSRMDVDTICKTFGITCLPCDGEFVPSVQEEDCYEVPSDICEAHHHDIVIRLSNKVYAVDQMD